MFVMPRRNCRAQLNNIVFILLMQTTAATGRHNLSLAPQMLSPPAKPSMKRL